MTEPKALSRNQVMFVEEYLIAGHMDEAAENTGISERTARRWMALPQVQEAIEEELQEARQFVRTKLLQNMELAIRVIDRVLRRAAYPHENEYQPPSDLVVKYVALMLKYGVEQGEMDDLRRRVAELEAKVQAYADSEGDGEMVEKAAKNGQNRTFVEASTDKPTLLRTSL